jgi:hypothetical protein
VFGHKKDGRVRKLGYYVMRNFVVYILPSIDRIMKYRMLQRMGEVRSDAVR